MKPPHDKGPGNRSGGNRSDGGPRGRAPDRAGPSRNGPDRGNPSRGDSPRAASSRTDSPRSDSPRSDSPRGDSPRGGQDKGRQAFRGSAKPSGAPRGESARSADAPRGERLSLAPRPQERAPERTHEPRAFQPPRGRGPGPVHQDRRATEAPKGTVWLYGIHAVTAALANPARRLRRLLLTEDAETSVLNGFPQPWPMQAERVDRPKLDHILGRDAVHQGAALLTDPLTPPSLAQALERPGPVLVLDQVTDPRNVGAIMRSAAAFGVAAIIAQERNAPDETGALAKAASGALEKVPFFKAVNISRTLVALKAAGLWCIGLDASGAPLSGTALSDRRIALVLGAEGEGLRRLTRETCDELAGIGQSLAMESLNVSAAAAIALYEVSRKA